MTRAEILKAIEPYFSIDELVCNHTLEKWHNRSWMFLDTMALHTLLILRRDIFRKPIWINNHRQGVYQRGLRCNMCPIVKTKTSVYLGGHCLGKGFDLTIEGIDAETARKMIVEKQDLLPCPIRLEAEVSWVHFDVLHEEGYPKVTFFKG